MRVEEIILNPIGRKKQRGPRFDRRRGLSYHVDTDFSKLKKVRRWLRNDLIEGDSTKNLHLEHLEDEIINGGYEGAMRSLGIASSLLDLLEGNTDRPINLTTKWDGSPAIFAGINPETGKFVMGDKGIFAKTPRLMTSGDDIDAIKQDQVGTNRETGEKELKDKSGLRAKLKEVLKHLPKIFPSDFQGLLQGDLLFSNQSEISTASPFNDGEDYHVFTPQSLTYAVPVNSNLGKQIKRAKIGIVFHTKYIGNTIPDMQASFGADVSELIPNKDVWFRDASITDVSGSVTLTSGESAAIRSGINEAQKGLMKAGQKVFQFLEQTDAGKELKTWLKARINSDIRQGAIVQDSAQYFENFYNDYTSRMQNLVDSAKRQNTIDSRIADMKQGLDFLTQNKDNLMSMYNVWLQLLAVKDMFVPHLSRIKSIPAFKEMSDGSYEVRNPEGFVAVDHAGNAIKLIDRLTFSRENFLKQEQG